MSFRVRTALSVAALTIAVAACGSDSSVAPTVTPVTLDQALSELALPSYAGALGGGATLTGATGLPSLASSSCAYTASSQSFVCAPVTLSGLTFNQSYTLLSASGAKQAAFDAKTTDAVRAATTIAGTVSSSQLTFTIDGQQELTLSGLLSGVHTLNGTSTMHYSASGAAATSITATITITNLVLPAASAGKQSWPASGTIAVEATTSGLAAASYKAVVTFNGTSVATVTVTDAGVSKTCRYDLASTAPTCQ